MAKRARRSGHGIFRIVLWAFVLVLALIAATTFIETDLEKPVQFSLKQGSSLRSVARQLSNVGVVDSALRFELLARARGLENRIQAGNYEISGSISPYALLQKVTSGNIVRTNSRSSRAGISVSSKRRSMLIRRSATIWRH